MTALRVLIPAFSAKSYGGDSYFRSILPFLSREKRVECVIAAPDDRYAQHCSGSTRIHLVDVPKIFRGPTRVIWEQTELPRLARKLGAQVIFTANNSGVLTSGIPCVIAIRNMEPLTPPMPGIPISHRFRHFVLSRFTRASAAAAARIVAASDFVRETLVSIGIPGSKIHTVYHGIDDMLAPSIDRPPRGGFMAAAAKFVRYANLETMIRAFATLRADGYRGRLKIAGGGHDRGYESEIRSLARELVLEESVEFLGYRPREEVRALMYDADAFLFPSTLEACPFTLLEAMSQSAAIVATTAAPMPEFARDGAFLVPPTDYTAFAAAARRAVADPALRSRARSRSLDFRWSVAVDKLVDIWGAAAS